MILLYYVAKCVMCSAEKKKFGITDNGPVASTSAASTAAAEASPSARYLALLTVIRTKTCCPS